VASISDTEEVSEKGKLAVITGTDTCAVAMIAEMGKAGLAWRGSVRVGELSSRKPEDEK
jgi:hypothetical protein